MAATTSAQSQSDLQTTILTQVMKDPRASSLPPSQLQAIVNSLTTEAQKQSMTSANIEQTLAAQNTLSGDATETQPVDSCDSNFLCNVNQIFGFPSDSYSVVFGTVLFLLLCLIVVRRLLVHHRTA